MKAESYAKSFTTIALAVLFMVSLSPELIGNVYLLTNPATQEHTVSVNVNNMWEFNIENLRVSVWIPELNIYERTLTTADLDDGEKNSRLIEIPFASSVAHGLYLTRVVASSDEYKDAKVVWLYI